MLKLNGLFASKKQIAGLDIGSSSVKIAEIAEGPDGYILQSFASIPLAKGIIADGLIVNQPALVERIKELLKVSHCKARTVVTSLSGYSVIAKKIGFPSMDEESLRELISDEIEKYLPFGDMKDVNFDFQILGPSEVSTGQMEVFLVAAKKDVIQSYVDVLKKAGLDVVIMDVDSFALETMYEENYDYGHEDVVIIVNIGASMTNINVVKGGASIFIRDFPLGGFSITENLQDKTGVSFEEAERVKLKKPPRATSRARKSCSGMQTLSCWKSNGPLTISAPPIPGSSSSRFCFAAARQACPASMTPFSSGSTWKSRSPIRSGRSPSIRKRFLPKT